MKAGAAERPGWLTETLQKLRRKTIGGAAGAKVKKQLKEDCAMRGILVSQFGKLAEVVREILKDEVVKDEGPYAKDPGSPLGWLQVNMYHICHQDSLAQVFF